MKVRLNQILPPVPFIMAGISDMGCIRKENQDAWLADESVRLALVADGMGGGPAGAQAAQTVTGRLPELMKMGLNGMARGSVSRRRTARRFFRETVLSVSREILQASENDLELKGMGATVVAAWQCGNVVHVAHQGDSRGYLFRGGAMKKLTADHSIIALLVRNGEITEEEACKHPARGQLTRFVGMPGDVYCEVQTVIIDDGDRLLLCTDGLWGVVRDDEIATAMSELHQPADVCSKLIGLAVGRGAPDNVTALVWDLGGAL